MPRIAIFGFALRTWFFFFVLIFCFSIIQLSLKSLAFNTLTVPDKESGLSCLQSACIRGDIQTASAIFTSSPDKLHSAIACSVKIGHNSSHCAGQSIFSFTRQQDASEHKQLIELVEKVAANNFPSDSLLHLAAIEGHVEHIRRLLDCGEYVDSVLVDLSAKKETPLMLAARFNDVEVTDYLVERGASLEMQDGNGFTPIHHAAMGGKPRNILRLIELGADVSKENAYADTCETSSIHLAAENGHTEAVQLLLEHGAHVSEYSTERWTPLLLAAKNGHLEIMQLLLKNGDDLDKDDCHFKLPLHFAAEGDHINVVKFIVQNGGDVLSRTDSDDTVLHFAKSLELVRFLVERGADVHARNSRQMTPLHLAARKGQSDTVTYLLNQGADINSRDEYGCSALWHALEGGHAATAKVLIDRGCDLMLTTYDSDSKCTDADLVVCAAQSGHTDMLQLLLDQGLSVDTITRSGQTLLMVAAVAGQCETVSFLLDRGANISAETASTVKRHWTDGAFGKKDTELFGTSPLYCALEAGQRETAKLLIDRGADTYSSSDGNNSLVELAAKHGFFDIAERLSDTNNAIVEKLENGNTLLTLAAGRGDYDSVRFLLKKGDDVGINARNTSGDTALSCAIRLAGHPYVTEIVHILLDSGADLSTPNDTSETPLQIACERNFTQVAEFLLKRGCEANTINVHSYSPLHYAAKHNNRKRTERLLQYGADASIKTDEDEMTPLHLAARNKSVHAAQVLLQHGVDVEATNMSG